MTVNEIKKEAKERLSANRHQAMLVYAVVFSLFINLAVLGTLISVVALQINRILAVVLIWYGAIWLFLYFILQAPIQYGLTDFYIKSYRCKETKGTKILDGFSKHNFERVILCSIIRVLLGLVLTVLLIVPGIIYAIRTTTCMYLLRANPKMKPIQALKASNKIMKGHSWQFFCMIMSFIGWFLLGIVSLGLAFIWMQPYFNTSKVVFFMRNLQGDKTNYKAVEVADAFDDDDKNVAAKLMKLQLSSEIEMMDKKIKTHDKSIERTTSNPMDGLGKTTSNPIDGVVPSTAQPMPAQPEIDFNTPSPKKSSAFSKSEPKSDDSAVANFRNVSVNKSFTDEVNSVNDLIDETAEVPEVPLPVVKGDKPLSEKDKARESIRKRIEQMRVTRENNTQTTAKLEQKLEEEKVKATTERSATTERTISPSRELEDEFKPEILDVEIIEED